jgi:hypothetical protein
MAELDEPVRKRARIAVSTDGYEAVDTAAALQGVLPYLGRALGLQGLACLASSSRQMRRACFDLTEQDAKMLLLDALPPNPEVGGLAADAEAATAAALISRSKAFFGGAAVSDDKRLQQVIWSFNVVPGVASSALSSADVLQRLLHFPHVPRWRVVHCVQQLATSKHAAGAYNRI